ncbi:MAG: PadR family transcriptional regulator [Acidimicrobiales bacterium]
MLKYVLLGLLAGRPRHGYELKSVFEDLLAGTWALNVAQIYTALARLDDDGLVACEKVPQEQVPDRKVYSLTPSGQAELARWAKEPVVGAVSVRDEFVLKIMVATMAEGADPKGLVWAQRDVSLKALADLIRLRDQSELALPTAMLVDAAVLRVRADLEWLDACEQRLSPR